MMESDGSWAIWVEPRVIKGIEDRNNAFNWVSQWNTYIMNEDIPEPDAIRRRYLGVIRGSVVNNLIIGYSGMVEGVVL